MKRLGLILLCASAALACDLRDRSIGDTGSNADDDGDSNGGDPTQGGNCTTIGCEDAIFLTLQSATGQFDDGSWEVEMMENDGPLYFLCGFNVVGGQPAEPDCILNPSPDGIVVLLPADQDDVTITVYHERSIAGQLKTVVDYEEVAPNGPDCEPICLQASHTMTVETGVNGCDEVEGLFLQEVENVRSCTEASECGQVIEGTSCGCTRDWVARLDADLEPLQEILARGVELECDWAFLGGACDCPEADGFDCIDNQCEWNYVGG